MLPRPKKGCVSVKILGSTFILITNAFINHLDLSLCVNVLFLLIHSTPGTMLNLAEP